MALRHYCPKTLRPAAAAVLEQCDPQSLHALLRHYGPMTISQLPMPQDTPRLYFLKKLTLRSQDAITLQDYTLLYIINTERIYFLYNFYLLLY